MKFFLYLLLFFIIACNTGTENKPADADFVVQDGTLINDTSTILKDTVTSTSIQQK